MISARDGSDLSVRSWCWPTVLCLALIPLSCAPTTDPGWRPLEGTPPRQFVISADPSIRRHPDPDSSYLIIAVTARDSTPHAEWRPSQFRLTTDRGFDSTMLLVPFTCLEPNDSGMPYPFSFGWLACDLVGVQTSRLLSSDDVLYMERTLSGRLVYSRAFTGMPGAVYWFRVPVGVESTAEAVRRASTLDGVTSAFRINQDPECVRSDVVPPPPCPPWTLEAVLPFSYASSPRDSIPVRSGGWVRVSYTDQQGTTWSSEYQVP
jgi:hypothetical protein